MPRLTHIGARAAAQGVTLRPVKARPPTTGVWQRAYTKRLRTLHQAWADHVETIGRRYLGARADAWRTDGLEDDLRAAYDALVKASGLDAFLGRFAGGISDANRAYVKRVTRLPPGNVARQQVIEEFRRENVALIKGLSDYQATQVADTLREAQATGARWEDVQPDIQERLGVSMSRAKLIARDQTNKFSGAMQQVHQTASGITEYTWMTMNDMAVRGRPGGEYAKSKDKHWPLHGTRQRWDSPPLIPGTSEHLHPGQDIQCRCQAIPVVSFFEDT